MNYEKIKELLLDNSRKLTLKEATEILDFFQKNPKNRTQFLKNKNCFQYLENYIGLNEETNIHEFAKSSAKVPSLEIAIKFLETRDETIWETFFEVFILSFDKGFSTDVFAWPYMDKDFLSLLSSDMLENICSYSYFVFDFKNDNNQEKVSMLLDVFLGKDYLLELLAINSFNIDWQNLSSIYDGNISVDQFVKLFALSSHSFLGDDINYFRSKHKLSS